MISKANLQLFAKFLLIGCLNSVIDLGLYLLFRNLGFSFFWANLGSTTVAMAFSFYANSRFTFRAQKRSSKQIALFVLITLIGLWVLHPLIIWLSEPIFSEQVWLDPIGQVLAPKLLAIVAGLFWNFFGYKYLVFSG